MKFNDLGAQHARHAAEIERRMQAVLAHAQFILGPEVAELEQALAELVGVEYCVSVGSGTQALELALRALGIGPGDEVITVAFSWISTAEAVALVGATPVFIDIEPHGFTLDPALIARALTPRTRAILPVSLFGQMANMGAIRAIADAHGLAVIEDAAQSLGASQNGQRSCAASTIGCTSFFPTKPLGCYGDGGALFTSDPALAKVLRALRSHGSLDRREHTHVGTNARLDTLQAAVLLAKLPHFERELDERRQLAERYASELGALVSVPPTLPGNQHVFAQYTLRHADRDRLAQGLAAQGIPTQIHYQRCIHQQPVFARPGVVLPESERAAREVLSLPLYPGLERASQDRVIGALVAQLSAFA